jgi:hypothetical protein
MERKGMAWHGKARHGMVKQSMAWEVKERKGMAEHGKEWHGMAWQGMG